MYDKLFFIYFLSTATKVSGACDQLCTFNEWIFFFPDKSYIFKPAQNSIFTQPLTPIREQTNVHFVYSLSSQWCLYCLQYRDEAKRSPFDYHKSAIIIFHIKRTLSHILLFLPASCYLWHTFRSTSDKVGVLLGYTNCPKSSEFSIPL